MPKPITTEDVAGIRHGSLEVVSILPRQAGEPPFTLCRCDCGQTTVARWHDVKQGRHTSCGCGLGKKNRRLARMRNRTHEHTAAEWGKLFGVSIGTVRTYASILRETPAPQLPGGPLTYESDDPGRHPEMGRVWDAVGARLWWDRLEGV